MEGLETKILDIIEEESGISRDKLNLDMAIKDLGFDSIGMLTLAMDLEADLGMPRMTASDAKELMNGTIKDMVKFVRDRVGVPQQPMPVPDAAP